MYGLPADFKADFFCGKTLDLVCLTRYQTYLHFSGECLVSIEGEISIGGIRNSKLPNSLSDLYPLIDQEITVAESSVTGTLSLTFEKGKTLLIKDSNENFESYSISDHGILLVRV